MKVRPAIEGDWPFITHSWIEAIRNTVDAGRALSFEEHWDAYVGVVDRVKDRVRVLVAANPETPDQIFGYLVTEDGWPWPVVHFLYVKAPFRGFGVASGLLAAAGLSFDSYFRFPFRTGHVASLKRAGLLGRAQHDPLILRFNPQERHLEESHEGRSNQVQSSGPSRELRNDGGSRREEQPHRGRSVGHGEAPPRPDAAADGAGREARVDRAVRAVREPGVRGSAGFVEVADPVGRGANAGGRSKAGAGPPAEGSGAG